MTIELEPLPYPPNALAPHISERTMSFHYGRHHAGYVANVNRLTAGTALENATIDDIVRSADAGSGLFNSTAQAWNHTFYWRSMAPDGGGAPSGGLAAAVEAGFGSVDAFVAEFIAAAVAKFGSGWTWLVASGTGSPGCLKPGCLKPRRLQVVSTDDADTPLRHGQTPLLTIDVWEHAYYLDYQNARAAYVDTFVEHLINWEFAARNWERLNRG